MTRVSFYVLKDPQADIELFICRLLERVHARGQPAYVHQPEGAALQALDQRLWTYSDESFLPHDLESVDPASPVVLGNGAALPEQRGVLLNLEFAAAQPPEFFSSFERCLEFVSGDAASRAQARQRYAFYRDRGYELETFNID